jgi:fructose-1-phosphate kinase PfkB-like protein
MIVVISLNTPFDVTSLAPGWQPNTVIRAESALLAPAGKALNVARFAVTMGARCHAVVLADATLGLAVERTCTDLGIGLDLVRSGRPSRIDTAVLDGLGGATVLNAQGEAPADDELAECLARLADRLGLADVLVVAGSLPRGITDTLVGRLLEMAAAAGATAILDTSGPELETGLRCAPRVAKINRTELADVRASGDAGRACRDGRAIAPEPANLVITDGSRGLRAWLEDGSCLTVRPPKVKALDPVGAGDALTAGIAAALDSGRTLRDGLVTGTAWAAAKVTALGMRLDADTARALVAGVTVEGETP